MSTLAASYLAKARGSGEPERSVLKLRDLENFVREVEASILDHGHIVSHGPDDPSAAGGEWDQMVQRYRARFEQIMDAEPMDIGAKANRGVREKAERSPV
jgi:hypothetical protein